MGHGHAFNVANGSTSYPGHQRGCVPRVYQEIGGYEFAQKRVKMVSHARLTKMTIEVISPGSKLKQPADIDAL